MHTSSSPTDKVDSPQSDSGSMTVNKESSFRGGYVEMATDAAESAAGGNSLDFVATFCHEMGHVIILGFADAL